jgi:hypothetical protein
MRVVTLEEHVSLPRLPTELTRARLLDAASSRECQDRGPILSLSWKTLAKAAYVEKIAHLNANRLLPRLAHA